MERSKKYVSSSTNRPPISPKPFTLIPSSTAFPMGTSSSEGWQKSYFMTKPHQEPSLEVTNKNPPLVLSRNPITAVEPSSTNIGGITVKTEQGIDYELGGRNLDLNMDIRKLRRLSILLFPWFFFLEYTSLFSPPSLSIMASLFRGIMARGFD